jgi:hypothetical protein
LADFNATEMPSIGMITEPTGVLISQRKKFLHTVGNEPAAFGVQDLLSNQFGYDSSLNFKAFKNC